MNLSPSILSLCIQVIKRYPIGCFILCLSPIAVLLETNLIPYGMKIVVDSMVNLQNQNSLAPTQVQWGFGIIGGSWVGMVCVYRLYGWVESLIIPRIQGDIRIALFNYVLGHSYGYFLEEMSGNLSNKIMDLSRAFDAIRSIVAWNLIATIAVLTVSFWMMWSVDPLFVWIFGIWVVIHLVLSRWSVTFINEASRENAEDKSILTGRIVDTLSNIIAVKLFAQRKGELEYMGQQQAKEQKSNRLLMRTLNRAYLAMDILVTMMLLIVLYIIFDRWKDKMITSGDAVLILSIVFSVMHQMSFLAHALAQLFRELGVAQHALEHLVIPQDMLDHHHAQPMRIHQGRILFENVTFGYGNHPVFQAFNLVINPGEKVGLVGFSGSGKTTMVNLLLRLFDPNNGIIAIDGEDIRQFTQDSLHQKIGVIPQDTQLFHRTLIENIRYGCLDASDEDVINAARQAKCHEFIMNLPQGYQTFVGERGIKLSGGQRQRIGIARVILKNAPILVLDEAMSALDLMTEETIHESLSYMMKECTIIAIAHRLSTLLQMDRLVVLDQGKIIEMGTHEDLLKQNGHYARMWSMQVGGFFTRH